MDSALGVLGDLQQLEAGNHRLRRLRFRAAVADLDGRDMEEDMGVVVSTPRIRWWRLDAGSGNCSKSVSLRLG